MNYFTFFAIYFVVWWITLFACLPIGLKTQAEANEVVPGSVESAPHRFQARKVLLLTTLISAAICGIWWIAVTQFGLTLDSLPVPMPNNG